MKIITVADRIQARAIRRCGELLKQVEAGKNRFDEHRHDGSDTPINRTAAATQAGLSERQKVTALRVASNATCESYLIGITHACAGSTSIARTPICVRPAHPRVRGKHGFEIPNYWEFAGSPTRAREARVKKFNWERKSIRRSRALACVREVLLRTC